MQSTQEANNEGEGREEKTGLAQEEVAAVDGGEGEGVGHEQRLEETLTKEDVGRISRGNLRDKRLDRRLVGDSSARSRS